MQNKSIVQQFDSEQFGNLRVVCDKNGEPWFVATDVAKTLGYRMASDMTRSFDQDEKGTHTVRTPSGEQNLSVISEAGFYRAILTRRSGCVKDEAVKKKLNEFQRWVTHEVLPSIRKHGAYITPQTMAEMMADPRNIAKVFNALADEQQKVRDLTEDNARMLPKAVAYDSYIDTDGTYSIQSAARFLAQIDKRINGKRLYALLRADELVCKQSRCPTKKAIDRGLAMQKMAKKTNGEPAEPYIHLTQKGLDWCVTRYATMPTQMKAI